jgi:hypothetical protein
MLKCILKEILKQIGCFKLSKFFKLGIKHELAIGTVGGDKGWTPTIFFGEKVQKYTIREITQQGRFSYFLSYFPCLLMNILQICTLLIT